MSKRTIILAALCACWTMMSSAAWALPFRTGDVFAGVGDGTIKEFSPTGVLYQTLTETCAGCSTSETTGMAFDPSGNLYATAFEANNIQTFNSNGAVTGTFGSGYNAHPESIVIDNTNGVVYVGQADGTRRILEFSLSSGALLNSFAPATQSRGTDWIDLGSDLKTIHYTSEGTSILSFNTATNTQNPNFANGLPGSDAYAHRILSNGGELVADTSTVVELDSSGNIVRTYSLPTSGSLFFALNLDPNGTDFWTATFAGEVFEVNIATGAIDEEWNAGALIDVAGLSVFGEICTTCGPPPPPGVPEPSAFTLLGSGLIGLAGLRGLRRRVAGRA